MNAPERPSLQTPAHVVGSIGPTNSIVDVADVRIGHASEIGSGALTGTTCVLPPTGGA